jgi:RHS repeat-associated protein
VASNFDSKNRLQVNGAAYDNGQPSGNGNQTAIGGYTYTYDAENRMVSAVLNAGATLVSSAGYVYDGAGQRVQKMTCWSSVPCTPSSSDATITTYVYDAFGNLAQEYGPYLNAWCATPTCYLTQDQIGSTRMVTDANGLVGTRYDFLPFGEEVPAGTGGRTQSMGYNGWEDNSNPKFAGQMRDPESARDLMGLRYYSPQEGRFVSVDPGNAGADGRDPQTWNGYSYVGNNPVNITDPSGESWFSVIAGVFAGLVTMDPGIGALVAGAFSSFENVVNGQPPSVFGSSLNSGDILGCGGPLGNCGSLGGGPWSENSGLGDVQDPGRFISNAQPGQYVNGRLLLPNGDVAIYDPNGYFGAFAQGAQRAEKPVHYAAYGTGVLMAAPIAADAVLSLSWMQVAVGPGEPAGVHFAYGVDGAWLHGTRAVLGKGVEATSYAARAWAERMAWFQVANTNPLPGGCSRNMWYEWR